MIQTNAINLVVDDNLLGQIDEKAKEECRSRASLVRKAINDYLNNNNK